MTSPELAECLGEAQRLGFLGDRPVDDVIEHARAFVRALPAGPLVVVDLGSGGGVPGLVVANDRPDLRLTLIDRRTKRTDFLERVVRRLGWLERVEVIAGDVEALARERPHHFNAVTARGFGPPMRTVDLALRLLAPGGRIVISEPPAGDRWDPAELEVRGLNRLPSEPAVAVLASDP